MRRTVVLYGLAIAAGALALELLEYQFVVRRFGFEIYVGLVALGFMALGVWAGMRLAPARAREAFERNQAALDALGISAREVEVLELLAEGCSNQEIADRLFVSPNTVKTHLSHLYGKLDVRRRTQAVQKARALEVIP